MAFSFKHPYQFNEAYKLPVAYFCMEYAVHQPLKLYAGGLGYLAGSHLRAAFEMKQNLVGIGILWKYGYYDQVRKGDRTMDVLFLEKVYGFLEKTGIKFTINVSGSEVWVTAYYLPPHIFGTAPLFLLSTDLPENNYLSHTICHKLYDSNPETKTAAAILLGAGGAKLLEYLDWKPEVYHLNESHALALAFYLYKKYKDVHAVRQRLVFTNHTPEEGGNPKTELALLARMGFFCGISTAEAQAITKTEGELLNHTHAAFMLAGASNAVSHRHLQTLNNLWRTCPRIETVISITNAQHFSYWADKEMYHALATKNNDALWQRKLACKEALFEVVADQDGEIFDKNVLTIVFAKRFAGYKRPDLLLYDMQRFDRIVGNKDRPVQIIWAGKPYPMDYTQIGVFDRIVNICKTYPNCAILVGYELRISKLLKQGADIWLNVPRLTHEASGTSGMSAAMNGAINMAIPDGWFPEFTKDRLNSFVIPPADPAWPAHRQDDADATSLYDLLENTVIPMYYEDPYKWVEMIKQGMQDIKIAFDSNRMVHEYYEKMYKPLSEKKL